jgi:hypothetical protein
MKRYNTPRLVEVGTISTMTQGNFLGANDGDDTQSVPIGSVGFNL